VADDHYRLADDPRQRQNVLDLLADRARGCTQEIQAVLAAHDTDDPEASGQPGSDLPPRHPVIETRVNDQDGLAWPSSKARIPVPSADVAEIIICP
jgi:hypothetical protein